MQGKAGGAFALVFEVDETRFSSTVIHVSSQVRDGVPGGGWFGIRPACFGMTVQTHGVATVLEDGDLVDLDQLAKTCDSLLHDDSSF
jgi:hypothetical protein